ncbi:MAG: hypothetical protein ACJAVK_001397 [Akkermansiaceae bacterium]
MPKIIGGRDEGRAKEFAPDPVHDDASGEGVPGGGDGFGELEPSAPFLKTGRVLILAEDG